MTEQTYLRKYNHMVIKFSAPSAKPQTVEVPHIVQAPPLAEKKAGRPKGAGRKETMTIRLDRETLEWFRSQGSGWQGLINEILSDYAKGRK